MHEQHLAHLAAVDAQAWPSIASAPEGSLLSLRARIAEAQFAKACDNAGLELDPSSQPDLIVDHEFLFHRIAQSGWLGLVESYMAGEWRTPDSATLVKVLSRLLTTGYAPRGKQTAVRFLRSWSDCIRGIKLVVLPGSFRRALPLQCEIQ